mmetsp:Transcript_3485/g.13289  ORF Transcript_3485/g.13289 Transcript_3485/m.13289 type:complete len:87 (-) Transcript_3485:449-709(-)
MGMGELDPIIVARTPSSRVILTLEARCHSLTITLTTFLPFIPACLSLHLDFHLQIQILLLSHHHHNNPHAPMDHRKEDPLLSSGDS